MPAQWSLLVCLAYLCTCDHSHRFWKLSCSDFDLTSGCLVVFIFTLSHIIWTGSCQYFYDTHRFWKWSCIIGNYTISGVLSVCFFHALPILILVSIALYLQSYSQIQEFNTGSDFDPKENCTGCELGLDDSNIFRVWCPRPQLLRL